MNCLGYENRCTCEDCMWTKENFSGLVMTIPLTQLEAMLAEATEHPRTLAVIGVEIIRRRRRSAKWTFDFFECPVCEHRQATVRPVNVPQDQGCAKCGYSTQCKHDWAPSYFGGLTCLSCNARKPA
jgi:hypothetical protein